MDRDAAFKMIRDAISAPEPKQTDYADPGQFRTAKAQYDAKLKGCVVGAVIILEDVLNDFKMIAGAMREMSQKPTISYGGPLHFQVVGDVASTFDPEKVTGGTK